MVLFTLWVNRNDGTRAEIRGHFESETAAIEAGERWVDNRIWSAGLLPEHEDPCPTYEIERVYLHR
jgi:hypothetical protein